jgi:hypothetical protein
MSKTAHSTRNATRNVTAKPEHENPQGPTASGRGHGPLERVTVNLTPRASKALAETAQLTGDSKTDTINRALQVYAFVQSIIEGDGALYVRRSDGDEMERLTIM